MASKKHLQAVRDVIDAKRAELDVSFRDIGDALSVSDQTVVNAIKTAHPEDSLPGLRQLEIAEFLGWQPDTIRRLIAKEITVADVEAGAYDLEVSEPAAQLKDSPAGKMACAILAPADWRERGRRVGRELAQQRRLAAKLEAEGTLVLR